MDPFSIAALGSMAIGGLSSLFGHHKKPKVTQLQRFTGPQQMAMNQLLSRGLASTDFGPLAAQARKSFTEQTIPSLAERFTSLGAGSQGSSAFAGTLGQAGSDLESQLAALKSQMGMQQLGLGLTPQFENLYEQGRPGTMQQLGSSLFGMGASMLPYSFMPGGSFANLFGGSGDTATSLNLRNLLEAERGGQNTALRDIFALMRQGKLGGVL